MELWSGTIGALVSAVAAALVALLVVKSTNASQRKESANDRTQNRELVDRQLNAAVNEASKSRLILATADFVGAVKTSFVEARDPAFTRKSFAEMSAAVIRMRVESESSDSEFLDELDRWCSLVLEVTNKSAGRRSNLAISLAESRSKKSKIEAALSGTMSTWPNATKEQREFMLLTLVDHRNSIDPTWIPADLR